MRNGIFGALAIFLLLGAGSDAAEIRFPEIPGWRLSPEIQTFGPKNLYEYIDGAADLYLTCDFEELNVAEYAGEAKAAVTVEIYRHRTPRDAFGIYSQERLPEATLLSVGAQGAIDANAASFVQGRYYVKISGFNTGAQDREIMRTFAEKASEVLGETGGLPAPLAFFPAEGKKSNSEKYIARNFLGYSFLHSVFTADYEYSGRKFRLFLIAAASRDECGEMIRQYLRQVKTPEQGPKEGRYTLSDEHHGVVDIYWKGRYIWGAVDLTDAGLREKYLKLFGENIREQP